MKLTPRKAIEETMLKQREDFARLIFSYEKIMAAIKDAATNGFAFVRVSQTIEHGLEQAPFNLAVSLKATKPAHQLIERLKTAGYNVEWVDASESERINGKETGGFILYEELRISWAQVRIHSGPQAMPAE